jgi:RoxA-like, cytochrome c-like
MKKRIWLAVAAIVVIIIIGGKWACENLLVDLPKYPPIGNPVWLDQQWSAEQRDWFHHADQGTQTFGIPYEWFIALEQPSPSLGAPGLLSDPVYLDRYGFIPDNTHPDNNPAKPGLPIGFAYGGPLKDSYGAPILNPQTKAPMTSLGLTCAACHTGRLTYQNITILIDGGPALTNLDKFQNGVGLALLDTRWMPFRFARFADRVLGAGASPNAKSELKAQLVQVLAEDNTIHKMEEKVESRTVEEGYARLDALSRIGNFVFSVDLDNNPANFVAYSAPVHFPRIWNSSWFEWVQYNGSIENPMTRNAGEALGVLAAVNLTGKNGALFSSSLRVDILDQLEKLLAGKPPNEHTGFTGLNSPKWPENILPPIDHALADKGAVLYKEICQPCHLPPVTDKGFWASKEWKSSDSSGELHLDLEQVPITRVGTDPAEAADMMNRRVAIPINLGILKEDFGSALGELVDSTVNYWYDNQKPPISVAQREQMSGNRPDKVRAELSYKVRPLTGIWATPPYLHNGSVPNIYALLSPVAERPTKFYLGNREYDPVNLGYRTDEFPGGFELDTSIRGNSNSGHDFDDALKDGVPKKEGVIGRRLTPNERRALIEYLKTF